jgi:hypothetical protein
MKMKNALLALTEAVRLARLEIGCYRDERCRGSAEGTLDRLSKLLLDEEVTKGMAMVSPEAESDGPSIVPEAERTHERSHG